MPNSDSKNPFILTQEETIEDLQHELQRLRQERDSAAAALNGNSANLFELARRRGEDIERLEADLRQAQRQLTEIREIINR